MISVIIPAYNRAATIERSVRSVLNQTVTDLEVIVVDDCSDDGLVEAVSRIDDERVRCVSLEKRSGACVARNRGIDEAKGEYIAFQDSDDEWLPEKLQIQLQALKENQADLCSCMLRRHYIGKNAKIVLWPQDRPAQSGFMDHLTLRRKSYISTQTILARREVFDSCRFDPKVSKGQDYDLIVRVSMKFKVWFVAEPLVEQYLQPDSISLSGYGRFVESRTYFLEKYKDICAEDKIFKLHHLQQIAHYKALAGMDPSGEYLEIFRIQKNPHTLGCAVLSRLHLINASVAIRNRLKKR